MRNQECFAFEEALLKMADEGTSLSSPILYALSGPSAEEVRLFRQLWLTFPVQRRRKIVATLNENAEANFELDFNGLFRVTIEDEDEQVRAISIDGLWEDEEVTLIAPLVDILRHDKALAPRAAAASSLGRFMLLAELEELEERYAKLVQTALLEVVQNPNEDLEVRRRAVESIAYWGEACVQDIIRAAYLDTNESMRISAIFAMGRSADSVWSETVQAELSNRNPAMRYEAARACGELEVTSAIPALIRLVSDPDREVQLAAIGALGQIGGQRARRVLERCARSTDEATRMAAEDALAELELGQQPLDLFVYDLDADLGYDEELEPED